MEESSQKNSDSATVIFGGGCFWCTEAVFAMLRGVVSVTPGYAGGTVKNPTYAQVCEGTTGHAEVVEVVYDPSKIRVDDLLTIFFASHDPTTLDRQGNDIGTQYRSVIFYTDPAQKDATERFITMLNASSKEGAPIVTEVLPLDVFYPAEDYHRDYVARNPQNSYCQVVINPKLQKVQETYADLLREVYRK